MNIKEVEQIVAILKGAIAERRELITTIIGSIDGIADEKWKKKVGDRSSDPDKPWERCITLYDFELLQSNNCCEDSDGLLLSIYFQEEIVLKVSYQDKIKNVRVEGFDNNPSWIPALQNVLSHSEQIIAMNKIHEEIQDLWQEAELLGLNTESTLCELITGQE